MYTTATTPKCQSRNQEFFFGGVQRIPLKTGQRVRGSGSSSPLVWDSTQFANEWNPYSDYVVTDVYSTELGIRLSFVKTSEFRRGSWTPQRPLPPGTPMLNAVMVGKLVKVLILAVCSHKWKGAFKHAAGNEQRTGLWITTLRNDRRLWHTCWVSTCQGWLRMRWILGRHTWKDARVLNTHLSVSNPWPKMSKEKHVCGN
jgi:hypothetical protein